MSIKYILLIIITLTQAKTIILDPLGDAHHTGRIVGQTYERSLTYKCAEKISFNLKGKHTVIISRSPGEVRTQRERAELSNRILPSLTCTFSCYKGTEKQISIITYKNQHTLLPCNTLFVRQDKAHLISHNNSNQQAQWAKGFFEKNGYDVKILCIPYRPLLGIKTPSLGIEFSINCESDLEDFAIHMSNVCLNLLEPIY